VSAGRGRIAFATGSGRFIERRLAGLRKAKGSLVEHAYRAKLALARCREFGATDYTSKYFTLIISLANSREVLYLVNRPKAHNPRSLV